ncbi:MAG: indolepyruvate ferredoxin oxidoreductase subunit alpha [Methanobrevibacter sp.]|jgi:indolepyruvate ferredoxin oxidoreductase alpha subunit|nr:indolepyruvate ferredoxin oxidoreductase subunit alpha [Candidatus Methanovirga australis]
MELKKLVTANAGEKLFLLGNESAVRGAIEAGVSVAATYPGTPSSEIGSILYLLAKDANMYFEFSVNEKVAMEVAATAATSGIRSFTFMKHVGLNVASDSFMTTAYTGVNGGMVILTADDPSMFSSQNEQDNRHYGRLAKMPILEPSNPQEIKDMMIYAFDFSEKFKIPVIIRTTTRVSHMRGIVEIGEIRKLDNNAFNNEIIVNNTSYINDKDSHWKKGYFNKNPSQYIPVPANSAVMHKDLVLKLEEIKKVVNSSDFNIIYSKTPNNSNNSNNSINSLKLGVISSGSAFNYVWDVVNGYDLDLDILKLGFTYPFPEELILDFVKDLDGVFIVEEVDPIMEKELLAVLGKNSINIPVFGKLNNVFPLIYEFTPDIIHTSFKNVFDSINNANCDNNLNLFEIADEFSNKSLYICYDGVNEACDEIASDEIIDLMDSLPNRPPTLCAGCGHRSAYFAVKKAGEELGIDEKDMIFASDIGCYTLGVSPPYETADYLLAMGSSVGDGGGFSKATNQVVLSFIGDSTFFHSGIAPLINGVHNKDNFVLTILDNRTTAMTGGQPNPGLPVDGMGSVAPEISIEKIATAAGCEFVKTVNPLNLKKTVELYKEAIEYDGVAVIIAKHPCTLIKGQVKRKPMEVDYEKCSNCLDCINLLACPAISLIDGKVVIDYFACKGCTTCTQMCKERAIKVKRD